MKILRNGDDFKKMSERNFDDVITINNMVAQGWNYCSRQTFKDFFKTTIKESKKEETKKEESKKSDKKRTENNDTRYNKVRR